MNRENKTLSKYRANFDAHFLPANRTLLYANIIELLAAEQFNWRGLPDTINSHCVERSVNTGLAAAYFVPPNRSTACHGFTVTPCEFIGIPDQTGIAKAIITHGTDYELAFHDVRNNPNVVLIKNNDYMYNEYSNLLWFADMLARTDESEKALIIWSKIHPIAKATTGIEAAKLKEIIRGIIDTEKMYDVINDNTKTITGQPTSRDDSVLRLGDENAVEKMHFLSEYHYELIRRYCNLYNIPFRTTAKSAQNLADELHNTDIFSQMINANRLKCRQDAAKEINEKFGLNVSVDFGELIKKENEVIENNIESTEVEPNEAESHTSTEGD